MKHEIKAKVFFNKEELEDWVNFYNGRTASLKTREKYKQSILIFKKWYDKHSSRKKIKIINARTLDKFKQFFIEEDLKSPAYFNRIRTALVQLLEYHYKKSKCLNFWNEFRAQKVDNFSRRDSLSDSEIEKLIKNQVDKVNKNKKEKRDLLIIGLMLFMGLRGKEVRNIRFKDIHKRSVNNKQVLFVDILRKGKKENERSTLELIHPVDFWFNDFLEEREKDSHSDNCFVISSTIKLDTQKYYPKLQDSSLSKIVKDILKKSGINSSKITAHSLRKTCATQLVDDFPIEVIQDILGHKNVSTTQIYSGSSDKKKSLAMSSISSKFSSLIEGGQGK